MIRLVEVNEVLRRSYGILHSYASEGDQRMPTVEEVKAWIAERSAKDRRLYERYGRPLEAEHRGEFVAISDDGEVLLGSDELTLSKEAVERFGPGNFAFRKIGVDWAWRMRMLTV